MTYKYGVVYRGKHKYLYGKIVKETPYFVYLQTKKGTIRVSKTNVALTPNPLLTFEEAKQLAKEWEEKLAKKKTVRRYPQRRGVGRTAGRVIEQKTIGKEEFVLPEATLLIKGKDVAIYRGKHGELYIAPTYVTVKAVKIKYIAVPKKGEPYKTTVWERSIKPPFKTIMIPVKRINKALKIIEESDLKAKYKVEALELLKKVLRR